MSKVVVKTTSPEYVLQDYLKLINMLDLQNLSKRIKTILKLNLSWTLYFPACSTSPWQLEGILQSLKQNGFTDLLAVENQTVVTHPWKGAYFNKWLPILNRFNVEFQPLTEVEWVQYKPKAEILAMYEIFEEILIPKIFKNTNMIHLPTIKTHGHTITTGAMKNAFGGLIPKYRHHAHKNIHEILVDLLVIQKEIHHEIFAVMDGGICGSGAGPRTMDPVIGNIILASRDQVAIDAVAAKIMGLNPQNIKYIQLAHDRGLGIGDLDQIEIIGLSKNQFKKLNFGFSVKKSPIIQWDQILRKKTAGITWLHRFLFHSPIFKLFIFASEFYHDGLWYPFIGKKKINAFTKTKWGKLYQKYSYGDFPAYSDITDWDPY